jgi:hypothetical protein
VGVWRARGENAARARAHMPSSCVPALKISTHGVSTLCLRRTSAGWPNTVPERALTILCDATERE